MARGGDRAAGVGHSTLQQQPRRPPEHIKSPPLPPLPPPTPQPDPIQRPSLQQPNYPSSWVTPAAAEEPPPPRRQHARRPSRAERYEALVESARELLESHQHGNEQPVGLGIDQQERLNITEQDWSEAVENLLKVVDGMARQLATHDELAAQLKIAQSNLTLAETHSEFLEETLRRRDSRSSAQMVSRYSASGTPSLNGSKPRAEEPRPSTESTASSLFGLGFEDPRNSAANFFRMPSSKRKQTPSVVSTASSVTSLPPPPSHQHTLRSSSSSPRLRTSSASYDDHQPPPSPAALGAGKTVSQLTSELFAMHAQVTSLEQSCQQLKGTNTSLRRSADALAGRCAELEKTKDDLMSELENLSMELFQEANTMVADERKLRAKAEEEVERLRSEISLLTVDLDQLRRNSSSTSSPAISLVPSSDKRDSVGSSRTMHPPSRRATAPPNATLSPYIDNSNNASPNLGVSSQPSPDPSETSSTGRKWFSFGRSGSVKATSSSSASVVGDERSPNLLAAPRMARADSGASVKSTGSSVSVVSFFSASAAGEEREELLDAREGGGEDTAEMDVNTPLVSDNGRARLPATYTPLPPSPNPSSPAVAAPPALRIDTSPQLSSHPRARSPTTTTKFQRSPAQLPSSFSTDSSPAASPRFPSSSLTPSSSRPVAVAYPSAEGQEIAKNPRSPNALRWAATSPRLGGAVAGGGAAGAVVERERSSSRGTETEMEKGEEPRPKEEPSRVSAVPLAPAPVPASAPMAASASTSPRIPGHRPPPLNLASSTASTSSSARPVPSPTTLPSSLVRQERSTPSPTAARATPSPPPLRPRTGSNPRPPFQRSVSARSGSSLSQNATVLPSPATYTPDALPSSSSSGGGSTGPLLSSMSTSTSLSSLRSPADDLEGLMRNIEDLMNFGADGDGEEVEDDQKGGKDEDEPSGGP